MTKKTFCAALALVALGVGCGNNNPPPPIVAPSGTQTVPYAPGLGFTGNCPAGPTGDFNTNCALCFQGQLLNEGGQPVCRFQQEVVAMPYGQAGALSIPILTPDNPSGPQAWPVYAVSNGSNVAQPGNYPITLKQGFHLAYSGSGQWDFATTGNWSGRCQANDFSGARRPGRTHPARPPTINPQNGQPEELFASDGIEAFPIGENLPDRRVDNDGILRVGFNIPMGGVTHSCAQFTDMRFTVSGCVNAAWASVPCRSQ